MADIYFEHLAKVCEIAEKYGFKPMIWNDMIFKVNEQKPFNLRKIDEMVAPKEYYEKYPENLDLVYYNYGGPYGLDDNKITNTLLDQ